MISAVIVGLTLLFATGFGIAYGLNPALRRQVEAPKYVFLRQLAQYDKSLKQHLPGDPAGTVTDAETKQQGERARRKDKARTQGDSRKVIER